MMQLSKHIFWDLNVNSIDFQKHARLIIERVVVYGDLKDWHKLKAFYGLNKIKQEVLQIRSLDKKTLNFLSLILQVPIQKFKCYESVWLSENCWNY